MSVAPVHIDLSKEIDDWKKAVYGEEVREANVRALQKMQNQSNGAIDFINSKGEEIANSIQTIEEVRKDTEEIQRQANEAVNQAKGYAEKAETEAERAKTEASNSNTSALESRSWAVGETGVREGENGNNSKYYCEKSKQDAERAAEEADRAAKYSQIVAPGFYVDPETMTLYMKKGAGVDFVVTENNVLCWKVA